MTEARTALAEAARYLFERGLSHGKTGNVSLRSDEGLLVSPTGSSLGSVSAADFSVVDPLNRHLSGPTPSKESFLHAAILRARPGDQAVVHTHSLYSAAISCLADLDAEDAIPAFTAYFAMRVGRVVLLPYHAPGDTDLGAIAETAAAGTAALLLRNHGPIVSAPTLDAAVEALEELEETAKLFFLLRGFDVAPLSSERRSELRGTSRTPQPERTGIND